MSEDGAFSQPVHGRRDIRVDFLHDQGWISQASLPGLQDVRFTHHAMVNVFADLDRCIGHDWAMRREQGGCRQGQDALERVEVSRHVAFRWINDDRTESGHQVACKQGPVFLFKDADVTSGVARRMQDSQNPAWAARQFDCVIVLKNAIDLNDSGKIARCYGVGGKTT
jgi:hypothetical protein